MILYGILGSCVAFCVHVWPLMVFDGFILPFLAVIDPNSFGLVYENTASVLLF